MVFCTFRKHNAYLIWYLIIIIFNNNIYMMFNSAYTTIFTTTINTNYNKKIFICLYSVCVFFWQWHYYYYFYFFIICMYVAALFTVSLTCTMCRSVSDIWTEMKAKCSEISSVSVPAPLACRRLDWWLQPAVDLHLMELPASIFQSLPLTFACVDFLFSCKCKHTN